MTTAKSWRVWTASQIAKLTLLRADGISMPSCARLLDRSLASIKNKCAEAKIEFVPRRQEEWLRIFSFPHTIAGAAEAMGVTKWAVKQAKRKLRRAGFDVPAAKRGNAA